MGKGERNGREPLGGVSKEDVAPHLISERNLIQNYILEKCHQ